MLSLLIALPILGSIALLFIQGDQDSVITRVKIGSLWIGILNALLSLSLFVNFDISNPNLQFVELVPWVQDAGISYHLGVDGISFFFIQLNNILLPLCLLASWNAPQRFHRSYCISFLLLTSALNGMFAAQDLLLFYIFFEAVLIPTFVIIGVWGGEGRVYATFKFFLYTFLGSVFMLLAVIFLINKVGTADMTILQDTFLPKTWQIYLFLGFFAAFAVKIPMWPIHTWLPDAHVEAPTAGSVMLAAILLKMGGYGLIRINLAMFPEASDILAPYILILSVIAVIYASLVALAQSDMKKLIAYSSVAHMGFVTAGIFADSDLALQGAMMQMLSHGIVSAALFLIVGVVYEREHSRQIKHFQGLADTMPDYALIFMIFMLASIALPGTSGFVGEILVIIGMIKTSIWIAALLASAMVLGAAYMLYLYKQVIFGVVRLPLATSLKDLSMREICVFAPLLILMFAMGLYPAFFIDYIHASLLHISTGF